MVRVSVERDDVFPVSLCILLLVFTFLAWSKANEFIQVMATRSVILNQWIFLILIVGFGISAFVMLVFAGPFVEKNQFILAALTLVVGMIIGFFLWQLISEPLDSLNQLVYTTIGGGFPYTGYDWTDYVQVTNDMIQLWSIQYVNNIIMMLGVYYVALIGTATTAIATTD
jgi:hypothetical protein